MDKRNELGFTLYELMITVLIIGVVLAYGIPNMGAFRQNSVMASTANDLHSSFHLARSESARAKLNISICASTDSSATVPVCGGQFEDGWVIFEDNNGDVVVDAGENVLRRYPATAAGIMINSQGAADYFSYAATGLGRGNVSVLGNAVSTLMLCDERGNATAAGGHASGRVLVVTPLGRATVLRDKAQIAFHGGC